MTRSPEARTLAALVACALPLALAACGGEPPVRLEGAVRHDLPVFEPATLDVAAPLQYRLDVTGGFERFERFEGTVWTFWTTRPIAEVLAFYEGCAPAAPLAEVALVPEIDPGAEGWDEEGFGDGDEDDFWADSNTEASAFDGSGFDGFDDVAMADDIGGPAAAVEVKVDDIGRPAPPLDLAVRTIVIPLPEADGPPMIVEVEVYLQPLQRRSWFSLREVQSLGVQK